MDKKSPNRGDATCSSAVKKVYATVHSHDSVELLLRLQEFPIGVDEHFVAVFYLRELLCVFGGDTTARSCAGLEPRLRLRLCVTQTQQRLRCCNG